MFRGEHHMKNKPVMDANGKFQNMRMEIIIIYYSEYGVNAQNKQLLFYDKGIGPEHILARGTFPNDVL